MQLLDLVSMPLFAIIIKLFVNLLSGVTRYKFAAKRSAAERPQYIIKKINIYKSNHSPIV
jgi:hypothetical protein